MPRFARSSRPGARFPGLRRASPGWCPAGRRKRPRGSTRRLRKNRKMSSSSTRSPWSAGSSPTPGSSCSRCCSSLPWSPSAGCSGPARLAVAALGTVLGGQAWLAVHVLLLGCVPLAGLTAYVATRRLVTARAARLWLAASYALLPVAIGSVAAGRLGTAVAFVLLPLIGITAGRMLTAPPRQARRAAWATGLLVALAAAFAPLVWVFGVAFAAVVLTARLVFANTEAGRWLSTVSPLNAVIVAVTPLVVLFPWSLH